MAESNAPGDDPVAIDEEYDGMRPNSNTPRPKEPVEPQPDIDLFLPPEYAGRPPGPH